MSSTGTYAYNRDILNTEASFRLGRMSGSHGIAVWDIAKKATLDQDGDGTRKSGVSSTTDVRTGLGAIRQAGDAFNADGWKSASNQPEMPCVHSRYDQ